MIRWFLALLLAVLQFLLPACVREPSPPLRVGTNIWPGYEPLYLARDLGYYDNVNIKLIQYPSASEVIRSFQAGLIEVAALTADEALLLKDRGYDPRVLVITDFSKGADVILGRPGMKTLADIKGKRVGVESTALGAFFLLRALEKEGMALDDVLIVPEEFNQHEDAFRSGRVDAVVTFEPVRTRLLAEGATLLFDSSRIPGEIMDVLVVRKEYVPHSSPLKVLSTGWFRAVDYLRKNPKESAGLIAPREGISPEEFLESLERIHIPDRAEYMTMLSGQEKGLQQKIIHLQKVMADKGLVRNQPSPLVFLDHESMQEIR